MGEIGYSKNDLSALENAEISDEDIDTIKSQEIVEGELTDEEKITIPGATYEVSERYYDLTRYVNDVNTDNTQVLQEFSQNGNLKSSHVYGNERIYSDIYDPVTEAFNVSNYNYDGRGSVVQTFTGGYVTSQLSYDLFGNLISGEPAGSDYFGFNAEETSTLTGLQYLRARYYDTNDGRFITADDYLGNIDEPLTLNRYAYTANNPVRYNDPSGHFMGLMAYGMKKTVDFAVRATKKTLVNIASSTIKAATKLAATAVSFISPLMGKTIAAAGKSAANSIKNSYYRGGSTYNNGYKPKNNNYTGKKTGGTTGGGTSGGKQKQADTIKKVITPVVESFFNMSGAIVQIAVGSSQIKKHLDQVKKKVVEFYCGNANKINNDKIIKESNVKYKYIYKNDINGIGMLSDGTIYFGRNAKLDDVNFLVVINEMNNRGFSKNDINLVIENYTDKNPKSVIKKDKNLDYYLNIKDITYDLEKEMLKNEYEKATIFTRKDIGTLKDAIMYIYEFKNTVQNSGAWDLKQQDKWDNSSLYYFDGKLVDKDAPGNIMYGYLGKAYGFPDEVLYIAAGYAQVSDGTAVLDFYRTYFDDPIDQENIRIGIDLYKKIHK